MQKRTPRFTFNTSDISNENVAFIEMDGQPIYQIKNLDVFYMEFGYTSDMRKAGILPDDFIRGEYSKGNVFPFAICFQMQLIDYLSKNSIAFMDEYGHQYLNWLDSHIEAATKGDFSDPPCRTETFCNIGMSGFKCQRV